MTDKEKIREEVVRMHNLLPVVDGDNIYLNYADRICTTLEMYIDSLQEEPVSIWHDASKKSDNPEDVVIINPSDNTGEVLTKCTGVNQGHIWAYTSELLKLDNPCNIGKNLQEPQVKESAEIQHVNETCKENGNSLTQEPVSEDLEEAIEDAMPDANWYIEENDDTTGEDAYNSIQMGNMFKAGAKWQKEKDESTTEDLGEYINELSNQFPEVSFAKLSRIAVRVAKWQNKQMVAKAIDAQCFGFQGAALFSFKLPADKYLVGSKVKVIVIKED